MMVFLALLSEGGGARPIPFVLSTPSTRVTYVAPSHQLPTVASKTSEIELPFFPTCPPLSPSLWSEQ
jgi:hypothetical protein